MGTIRPTQYELTYINHIVAGDMRDDTRGLGAVLPWFAPPHGVVGHAFEPHFAMQASSPVCRGRLHVSGKVGVRAKDNVSVFVLELTVRGAPESGGQDADMVSWMDAARELIVRTFVEMTSEAARRAWGQIQ